MQCCASFHCQFLQGTLHTCSQLAAEGLLSLLRLGRIAVQLVQADHKAPSSLCVSLHDSALDIDDNLGNQILYHSACSSMCP